MKHACALVTVLLFLSVASDCALAQPLNRRAGVDISSKVMNPPTYPADTCVSGTAIISASVDNKGRLLEVVVENSSDDRRLDAAALEAARGWRYDPGIDEKGIPIAGKFLMPVHFSIDEGDCWRHVVPDTPAYPVDSSVENKPVRWPSLVQERDLRGTVMLKVDVDQTGKVNNIGLGHSSSAYVDESNEAAFEAAYGVNSVGRATYEINSAALEAASQWTYAPALRDGKPVRSVLYLPLNFGSQNKRR